MRVDPPAQLAAVPTEIDRIPGTQADVVHIAFGAEGDISERVIFRVTESQSNGIEDARFVEFSGDGEKLYYAT